MISLKHRLTLTYAVFISAALGILTLVINQFTGVIFTSLIKDNIADKSGEIVRAIGDQYNVMSRSFDIAAVEAIGMYFVHDGYIVTVQDDKGGLVWDARACDMQECALVLNTIAERMESGFRLNGGRQIVEYPIAHNGFNAGTVIIETYGPFFFSETETKFLASINRLLIAAGIVFILLSSGISVLLASAIAKPIVKAGDAARRIAKIHAKGTDRRRLNVRLDESYKTRELRELSRAINNLAAELEEGERRQKQLSADIAHELRTPLTCLQGNIEAMIDGVWQADTEHLESCHEEIVRLTRLVEDLRTLTNFEWERIALNKTDVDLARLLETVSEQFSQAAAEKGIVINLEPRECADSGAFTVHADYDRLKQVFINVLSNAVHYTDSGGITIAIEKRKENCEVSVADTGIGIPAEEIPHIFERLYRSDKSRSRNSGGAGIGLAIAATIVAAHNGHISVTSEPGAGSVFTVRIPFHRSH